MTNEERITNTALCQYRFYNVKRFVECMADAAKFNKNNGNYNEELYLTHMYYALKAGIEAHATNAMLGVDMPYNEVFDLDMLNHIMTDIEPRALAVFERAEAFVEAQAAADFEHRAYGSD